MLWQGGLRPNSVDDSRAFGKEAPRRCPDGRCAFRTISFGPNETWLCRFDTETASETRLLKICKGEELVALSSRGRFALMGLRFPGLAHLFVVDAASGRRKRLDVSIMAVASAMILKPSLDYVPRGSPWLDDERRFLLSSPALDGTYRTYLYSVPDDWVRQ